MTSTPTDDDPVRIAYENGASLAECAKLAGTAKETIRRRAAARGWTRQTGEAIALADRRRDQTAAATTASQVAWAERRNTEADAAGIYAARARQAIIQAIDQGDHQMTRAAAIAYGILIDKAQVLSGGVTDRTESGLVERGFQIIDELAARRSG